MALVFFKGAGNWFLLQALAKWYRNLFKPVKTSNKNLKRDKESVFNNAIIIKYAIKPPRIYLY
ncbi:hypothetical protein GGTG_07393 [Gaeumannomyces tritici R3-111a-1]|uniref:Uncharacterized protein n=1 Tax=Gaeumannomyces tritici (strain R3-111a-1) TaxID=644352 RepID=J3P1J5_GAET3|nr:hypothetical protein GGTG_07393 [Gaeumannomyces tritici R3-111a-1]EJT73537.1 hypothetical protein GGTG_07393 [Gaeumannomyces tritici R3-111a-1]